MSAQSLLLPLPGPQDAALAPSPTADGGVQKDELWVTSSWWSMSGVGIAGYGVPERELPFLLSGKSLPFSVPQFPHL